LTGVHRKRFKGPAGRPAGFFVGGQRWSRFALSGIGAAVQLAGVRVPFYWWFPLACAVVGSIWWSRTRHMDFLTPPSDAAIAELRQAAAARPMTPDLRDDVISVPSSEDAITAMPSAGSGAELDRQPTEPTFEFGDLEASPALDEYLDQAPLGAEHLIGLAAALEQRGQFKRALLAWERVIDHGRPDAGQAESAVEAIRRLRPSLPPWHADPAEALRITLCAGTGTALAEELEAVLERIAGEIGRASGGVIEVLAKVEQGKGQAMADRPSPVALWLAGPEGVESSSAVVSFTARPGDPLRSTVLRLVHQLVSGDLSAKGGWPPIARLEDDANAAEALMFRTTRLGWQTFGAALQPPSEE